MSESTPSPAVTVPVAHVAHADHGAHSPEEIRAHMKRYITVFVILLVLTVVTVAVSYVHLGTSGNVVVALLIAVFKASLVASFFMHLSSEKWTIYRFLIMTLIFVMGLMLLSLLAFTDPIGR
jgi:cytochrome c oxidase subunit IV